MKGLDVPQKEIDHVRQFLQVTGNLAPQDKIIVSQEKIIRLIAWYALVRGVPEEHGEFYINPPEVA